MNKTQFGGLCSLQTLVEPEEGVPQRDIPLQMIVSWVPCISLQLPCLLLREFPFKKTHYVQMIVNLNDSTRQQRQVQCIVMPKYGFLANWLSPPMFTRESQHLRKPNQPLLQVPRHGMERLTDRTRAANIS